MNNRKSTRERLEEGEVEKKNMHEKEEKRGEKVVNLGGLLVKGARVELLPRQLLVAS